MPSCCIMFKRQTKYVCISSGESVCDRFGCSVAKAFHKMLGNFLATSRVLSNLLCFEQLLAF